MNFGEIVKNELVSKPNKDFCCKKAFLAGIIRGSGLIVEKNDGISLEFKVFSEELATIVNEYISSIFNYQIREVSFSMDKEGKNKFNISLDPEISITVLFELGIIKEDNGQLNLNFDFYSNLANKDCCFKSFLRGLFISSGTCTVPTRKDNKTRYHLEIVFSHAIPAQDTAGRLFNNGIYSKILRRKNNYVLYIKSVEAIKDFIAYLSAPVSVLKLTEIIIQKEMINDINRAKNCDIANLSRQVEASAKQLEAIEKIKRTKGLEFLKPELKNTAIFRIQNSEESLVELANKLGISKSCLNHRLRKIIEIAKEIQE